MKTSPDSDVREFYDKSADDYSRMMDGEIDLPMYHDTLSRLAASIVGLSGAVVDTSCGPGHMLQRYRERYDPDRALVGVDLSQRMVDIASARLDSNAMVLADDMRELHRIARGSAAAVISFFALHHLAAVAAERAIARWHEVLSPGGQLRIATWEGDGVIDYGDVSDIIAHRYRAAALTEWVTAASFVVDRCVVEPVDGLPMDAIYLEATRRT